MTTFTIFTIVVDDNLVSVDGVPHTTDCSSLAGEHAIIWNGTIGTVEYALVDGVKKPPTTFTDTSPYQAIIDAATAPPPPPPPPTPTQLLVYAQQKQQRIAQGGFTVNANTSGTALDVSVATSTTYAGYLSSAVQLAQMMIAGTAPTANINWVQNSGNLALAPQQVINVGLAVSSLVQQTFTILGQIVAAINAGTITTTAQIDTPPSPIPAWPVNS